jgi:hypothetical protein
MRKGNPGWEVDFFQSMASWMDSYLDDFDNSIRPFAVGRIEGHGRMRAKEYWGQPPKLQEARRQASEEFKEALAHRAEEFDVPLTLARETAPDLRDFLNEVSHWVREASD